MNRNPWRGGTLLLATITTGLTAGIFLDWSHTVMPGLATTDDHTFVVVFRALDTAILGPLFMLVFMGALVFTGIAAALHLRRNPWVPVAFVLYLAAFVITMAVHEPLNAVIRTAGDAADAAALRATVVEGGWTGWHLVRTAATTAAFCCLAWALVRHGRATATVGAVRTAPGPAAEAPR